MYSSLKNSEQILMTLPIFAIAAFKLLPTFNSILNSIQKISLGRFFFFCQNFGAAIKFKFNQQRCLYRWTD